jgi:hypothetical protein
MTDQTDRLNTTLADRYTSAADGVAGAMMIVCSWVETGARPRGARLALKGGRSRVFQDASPQGPSPLFRAGTDKADR